MRSKPVASLLVNLDVAKSHSWPCTSDDNPHSESQFKTMKRPDFPERFGSIEDARAHCQTFFAWYNGQHCHSGVGRMTPHSAHYGDSAGHDENQASHSECSIRCHTQAHQGNPPLTDAMPTAAWINSPPAQWKPTEAEQPCTVNL
jgi:putative transposase